MRTLVGGALDDCLGAEATDYLLGSGGTFVSDLLGRVVAWSFFMAAIAAFYRLGASFAQAYCKYRYPRAPTNNVPLKLVGDTIKKSYRAFPLYVCVPLCTDLFAVKGWSVSCASVDECGGIQHALIGCVAYFFALELAVYAIHYGLLHKSVVGKQLLQHTKHHLYKYPDQLNAFSGYAFAPQDGFSQGIALALCTLVIRVPIGFVHAMEVLTGVWTLYIHSDITPMPWPFMGSDYHLIHHRYNWYNFGFMTLLCDEIFRTVKHPARDARVYAIGAKQMPLREKRQSEALTAAILQAG